MNEQQLAYSFLLLAYRDYLAARCLLNNGFFLQGLTLSSSAIEKYFKVILALHGNRRKDMGVHLDRLSKLKALLAECYYDVTLKLDDRFLGLLSKAYKIRYYDNLSTPITISFFVNQLIGELDYSLIEVLRSILII